MNQYRVALDRLREQGWTKGIAHAPDGRMCLMGALGVFDPMPELERVIQEQYPERIVYDPTRSLAALGFPSFSDTTDQCVSYRGEFSIIPNFNNHPDTTFQDIERVLEKAAAHE